MIPSWKQYVNHITPTHPVISHTKQGRRQDISPVSLFITVPKGEGRKFLTRHSGKSKLGEKAAIQR